MRRTIRRRRKILQPKICCLPAKSRISKNLSSFTTRSSRILISQGTKMEEEPREVEERDQVTAQLRKPTEPNIRILKNNQKKEDTKVAEVEPEVEEVEPEVELEVVREVVIEMASKEDQEEKESREDQEERIMMNKAVTQDLRRKKL
jgi:hypothetical protein